ncbi:MAG: protein BatD [Candidatus Omnitrophica bacterium]|nr:protein BatD [Candidatus Omnitrophota bacterium]
MVDVVAKHFRKEDRRRQSDAHSPAGQQRFPGWRSGLKAGWLRLALALILLGAAGAFLAPGLARAEDITFEAAVQSNHVTVGTAVELTLTVTGEKDVDPPKIENLDGFETRYAGPTAQVSVINGTYSSSKAFHYILFPLKAGKFTIPSFELTVNGQVYNTQPIVVEVTAGAVPGNSGGAQQEKVEDISNRIKLLFLVPRYECFVNETLPVVIKLYYQEVPLQDITMPEVKNDGIVVGDYAQPRQYEELVDGVKFRVVEFQTSIAPSRTGQLGVGPVTMTANMLYKMEGAKSPFGRSVFDDDFFSGFFNSYQKRPLTITSSTFELNVKPLPEEGRPADFSGAVGQFDLQAEVGPAEVKAGDPVTLKAAIFGSGSLKNIRMPQVPQEGFKVYDPQIKEEGGRKSLEQVLIPTGPEVAAVPALTFNYFDPVRGQYATVTRGPFPVKVSPLAPGEEFHAVGYANARALPQREDLGRDIVFIKDRIGGLRDVRGSLARELPFYTVLVLFLNIWGIFLGIYLYRRRLQTDEPFARRQRAPRAARAAWAAAEKSAAAGQTRAFYDALEQGLRAFLADELSLPLGDAFGARAREELLREGVPEDVIARLQALESVIELARFASAASTAEEMSRHLEEARAVSRAVEEIL